MSIAITQIPQFYPTEFGTNWEFLAQQEQSRLREYVTVTNVNGDRKKLNQVGTISMDPVTVRAGKTKVGDLPLDARWLSPLPYDKALVFDEWDESFLGDVVLPQSEAMQALVMAYGRKCDEVIITGLGETAYSGQTGVTANTLPATQKVAVDYVPTGAPAASGLTLAKLIKTKSILGKNEVIRPGDELIFAYSQQQLDDLLLNVDQVDNSRYNEVKALVDGNLKYFMGFKFVRLELLPKTGTTRKCYGYVKSGIKFGDKGRRSYMDILPERSHALQIRTTAAIGSVRMEEKKVVEVSCQEPA